MSRPYAGMGVAAAGSAAAFWATDLYASNLASLPGEAVTNLSAALSTLPSYIATHGPLPTTATDVPVRTAGIRGRIQPFSKPVSIR